MTRGLCGVLTRPCLTHLLQQEGRLPADALGVGLQLLQRAVLNLADPLLRNTEQVADLMEDWLDSGAADGFNLMPPLLPLMLEVFIAEVVPLLQRRGRFRSAYRGTTLRDHYGLERPSA